MPLCKSYFGSVERPLPAAWSKVNDDLGGRLLQPPPPGAACHPGQPIYDVRTCDTVRAEWNHCDFRLEYPFSVMRNVWTKHTCLPEADYPCSSDGYPAFAVNATEPEHVKFVMDFVACPAQSSVIAMS